MKTFTTNNSGRKKELALINIFNDIGFIQFFHRILATLTLLIIPYTVYKAVNDSNFIRLKSISIFLGIFILCQYILGVIILKLLVPTVLGLFHQFGSLIILTNLIIILAETKNRGQGSAPLFNKNKIKN